MAAPVAMAPAALAQQAPGQQASERQEPAPATLAQPASVRIEGAGDLQQLLADNLQIVRLARGARLGRDELQRLVTVTPQQVRDLLATEGYFSPVVSAEVIEEEGRPLALLKVQRGQPTRVAAVEIRFAGAITADANGAHRMAALRGGWLLKPGEVFRQARWSEAKGDLVGALLVRDYPAARIADSQASVDPATHGARLEIEVDSGPLFTFGELQISGLKRYPAELVERLNGIKPGERYSQARLSELQARVLDTGYFRSAFATVEADPAHAQRAPIKLEVTENEKRRLGVGLGFSTDNGMRGQLKWLDRNFLARGMRLEATLRADRVSKLLGADLTLPALGDEWGAFDNWVPSVGASVERSELTGVLTDKIRNSARLTSPSFNNQQVLSVSLLADRRQIDELQTLTRKALVAGVSQTWRRLDQPLSPTRGHVVGVELSAGVGGVSGQNGIARAFAHATWIRPLSTRWTTVLRAQAGQVTGAGVDLVPEDLLFRTGGDQTVRGYSFGSLGVERGGAIVGGNVLAVASAELAWQFLPQWGAAVFSDAGNAAASWRDFRVRQGSGVGLRWKSPIGPVNLDVARSHDTHDVRLHFSVGYGF